MWEQCFYIVFCVFALGFSKAQIPGEFSKDYAAAYDSLEYNGEILDFPIDKEAAKQDDSQSLKRLIDDRDSDFLGEKSSKKLIHDEDLVLKEEAIKDAQKFLTTEQPRNEMKLEENSNETNLTEQIKSLHEKYLALESNDTEIKGKITELHKLTSKKPESFDSKGFIYDVERIFTKDNVEKRIKYNNIDDKPLDDPIQEDKRKNNHQQVKEYQLNLGTDGELFNPFAKENLKYLTDNEWPEFEHKVDIPQKTINNVGKVPNDKPNDKLFDELLNSENSVIKSIVEKTPQNKLKIDGKEIKDNIITNMSYDGKINVKEEILDEKKDNEKEVVINDDKEEKKSHEVQTVIDKMVIVMDEEEKNDQEEIACEKEETEDDEHKIINERDEIADDKQEIVKDQEEKSNNLEEKIKQKTVIANDETVTVYDKMATVKDIEQSKADLVNQLQQQIQEYINQTKKHNEDVAFKVKEEINHLFDKLNATDGKLENKQKESEDNDYRTPELDDQDIIDEDEIKYLSESEEILDEIYNLFPKFENLKVDSRSDINKQIRSAINQLLDELNLSIKNNMKFEPDYNENDEIITSNCVDVDSNKVLSYLFEKNNDADIKIEQLDPVLAEEEMSIITDNIRKKETNLAKNKLENNLEDISKEHDHDKTVSNEQQATQMETEESKNQAETTTSSIDELDNDFNKNLQHLIEVLDKSMSLSDDFYNNQNFSEQNASEQENTLGSDLKNENFEYDDYVYDDNIFDDLTTKKTDSHSDENIVSTKRGNDVIIEEVTQPAKFIETKDLTPQQYDELMKQFKLVNSDIINPESESFARNVAPIYIKLNADEPTVITSPNYPMPYPTNNIVDWIFEGEGTGIEMNITDFVVNGAVEDYVLIKPGGLDESGNEGLIFTYSLTSPRKYRFLDVDRMFIRFQSNQGLAFAKGFQISLKMIKPPKPENDSQEEVDLEDLLPPVTAMYTVNLGGISPVEFEEIKERFRLIIADMATMYCNAYGIDMGVNTTTEVTQINNTYICNINWPNFESCVSVRFGVPLVNETGTTGRLHEEDLAKMWATYVDRDPFAARLSRLGITEFTPPAERQVLSAWLLIGSAVLLTVALLAFALWRFSCIEGYTRMPAFSDTESVQQEKRDLDLYPTPHQTLPPLYEEPPFSWDQPAFDGSTRVDMGAFSNRNFVGDELFDIDSDQDFDQDVGEVRDRNARPKDYNV